MGEKHDDSTKIQIYIVVEDQVLSQHSYSFQFVVQHRFSS